jgi:hypothetical protein
MSRALTLALAAALAAGAAACGGGSSPSSSSSVDQSGRILVSQPSTGLVGLSARPEYALILRLPVHISEVNGVGLSVNNVRLQLYRGGAEIERAEVTADDFVRITGTNRIGANGTMDVTLDFYFNSMDFEQGTLTFEVTDDNGHTISVPIGAVDVELYDGVLE